MDGRARAKPGRYSSSARASRTRPPQGPPPSYWFDAAETSRSSKEISASGNMNLVVFATAVPRQSVFIGTIVYGKSDRQRQQFTVARAPSTRNHRLLG